VEFWTDAGAGPEGLWGGAHLWGSELGLSPEKKGFLKLELARFGEF